MYFRTKKWNNELLPYVETHSPCDDRPNACRYETTAIAYERQAIDENTFFWSLLCHTANNNGNIDDDDESRRRLRFVLLLLRTASTSPFCNPFVGGVRGNRAGVRPSPQSSSAYVSSHFCPTLILFSSSAVSAKSTEWTHYMLLLQFYSEGETAPIAPYPPPNPQNLSRLKALPARFYPQPRNDLWPTIVVFFGVTSSLTSASSSFASVSVAWSKEACRTSAGERPSRPQPRLRRSAACRKWIR